MGQINKNFKIRVCVFLCLTLLVITLPPPLAVALDDMPLPTVTGNCYRCHDSVSHLTDNCTGCHDEGKYEPMATLAGGHGGLNVSLRNKAKSTAPVGNCKVCHLYTNECENCHYSFYSYTEPQTPIPDPNPRWPANYTHDGSRINNFAGFTRTFDCADCHTQTWWPSIPQQQHNTTFGSAYSHSSAPTGCEQCHNSALTTEHYRRTNDSGTPLDCYTCHSSTSIPVRQAIKSGDIGCGACHNLVHNVNVIPQAPSYVLQYPGLKWTAPTPLSLWNGESWLDGDPSGYRIIISSRSILTADQVWNYYYGGLTANGWTTNSTPPDAACHNLKVTFTKGRDIVIVWFYSSEQRNGTGTVPTGSRVEIIFKG